MPLDDPCIDIGFQSCLLGEGEEKTKKKKKAGKKKKTKVTRQKNVNAIEGPCGYTKAICPGCTKIWL